MCQSNENDCNYFAYSEATASNKQCILLTNHTGNGCTGTGVTLEDDNNYDFYGVDPLKPTNVI